MLLQLVPATSLFLLPMLATAIFIAFFVAVILRVCQRARAPEYERMATLPLDHDDTNGDHTKGSHLS